MRHSLAIFAILFSMPPAAACEWDYDTLRMERAAFPGALELIVGKFLRHSDAFYEWRIEDRSAKIAAHEAGTLSLDDEELAAAYDDWAVALDKLGWHEKAVEVINEKFERFPEIGQYQTHANRGTFLIHAGRLEEGVVELETALEINPKAHFGREEYQVLLIERLIEKRGDAEEVALPLDTSHRSVSMAGGPFARWLLERQGLADGGNVQAIDTELERATKGVLGMMRFGDFESPILLEALGDLLLRYDGQVRGQRLAARAYLRAAMEVENEPARKAYREMARQSLVLQHPDEKAGERAGHNGQTLAFQQLEDQLAREMKETSDWFQGVAEDEALWIVASTDPTPDERFWQKYGTQTIEVGQVRIPPARFTAKGLPWQIQVAMGAIAAATAGVVAGLLLWRRRRPNGYE